MCYSLAGRIQSRIAALLAPAILAGALVARTGDQRYLTMFIVMALVALDLDLALYQHVLTYQARWHTYAFAAGEFVLTLTIVRWLAGTLPLSSIVWFYVAGWLGGYVILSAVLPVVDPLWAEHGGEIGRREIDRARRWTTVLWAHVRAAPGATLTLAALVFFTGLELTVLPSTLRLLQVGVAVVGAIAVGLIARRWAIDRAPSFEEAAVLGLLVALLLRGPGLWPFLIAGAAAVACRVWLWVDRRPVFNGAACVFVLMVLLVPGMYSGEMQWGNSLLLPLAMTNIALLVALRSGRALMVIAFGATVAAHMALLAYGRQEAMAVLLPQLVPVSLIFFGGFVMPDRATAPANSAGQLATGIGVAMVALLLNGAGVGLAFPVALLIVNYGTTLLCAAAALLPRSKSAAQRPRSAHPVTRRAFLSSTAAVAGSLLLGGSLRQLSLLDPAMLSLPAEPALAGGEAIPRFADVANRAGVAVQHRGAPGEGNPAIGTGVAWGDFDNNGRVDLYVTGHLGDCQLFRNNGDGTFTDVAREAGVARPGGRTTSAVFVDYDNDGWPDLYVGVAYGSNVLLRNNRDGTFTDVTRTSGLGDPGRTMSTAWADYDGDGYLDVFVVNYTDEAITFNPDASPTEDSRTVSHIRRPVSRLYHNNGDGTFTDVTDSLGYDETRGLGFSAVWFDYNHDGRPDLYVAYDFGSEVVPNVLWRNDGPDGKGGWRFTSVANRLGVATQANPMGVASGDYDNDGWLDLAVSNIGPNLLYNNHHGQRFDNVAERARVTHGNAVVDNMLDPTMTWGVSFADFNNDGWLDLYVVAGAMDYENVPQPSMLYANDHSGGFIDVSAPSGTNDPGQGRSVAVADYDGDGYLDMFVANYGQDPLLYKNVSRSVGNRWLRVQLEGTRSNRDAVGARVTLEVAGLPPQIRDVQIGQGLGSSNEKTLHFGLGAAERVRRVQIRWPSGATQVLHNVDSNQTLKVREPGRSRW